MKMIGIRLFPVLALTVFLMGCAITPAQEWLYSWGSYQEQVYSHLQGGDRQAQIAALEKNRESNKAYGKVAPPGFYAHLGLLYAETGDDAKAAESFAAEKARFPESAVFMDFLLKKYEK